MRPGPGHSPCCSLLAALAMVETETEAWGGVVPGSLVHTAGSWTMALHGLLAWGTCGPLDSAWPRRKMGR